MSGKKSPQPRKPATKFGHLQKKRQLQKGVPPRTPAPPRKNMGHGR